MRIITSVFLCLLVIAAFGCSQDQAPTQVTTAPDGDALKTPPPTSGPYVVRYDGYIAVIYPFAADGLQVVVGADLDEYCNGIIDFDVIPITEITIPADQDIVNQFFHGTDLKCAVYPLYPFDCERFVNEGPIASGFCDLVSTDNDLYAFFETNDHPRTNSYGINAHGSLTTPDGQMVQLAFGTRYVWPGYPYPLEFRSVVERIVLAFAAE